MKALITAAALAGMIAPSAALAADFQYNMITGQLPGTDLIAANVVRGPEFTGEKDEKVQAMDQAKNQLDAEYCGSRGGEFVVDNGLVLFDAAKNEWMVGGVCR